MELHRAELTRVILDGFHKVHRVLIGVATNPSAATARPCRFGGICISSGNAVSSATGSTGVGTPDATGFPRIRSGVSQ
jgi:hypothetical protein